MSAGGFGGGGGTRIAEFSIDIVTKGMERTLDMLDRLDEKLKAIDEKLDAQAKAAPGRERELTGFLDKWGRSFSFILGAATMAMAAVISASPALTSSMTEMRYAFEWMAFVIGEQLAPEFEALSGVLMKTAEDFEKWFAGVPEAGREAVSDLVIILGVAGMGAAIVGAIATVVPGVSLAMGGVYGAIVGAFIGLDLALADVINIQILSGMQLALASLGFLIAGPAGALAGAVMGTLLGAFLGFDERVMETFGLGFTVGFEVLAASIGFVLAGPAGAVGGAVIGALVLGLASHWGEITSWFSTQWGKLMDTIEAAPSSGRGGGGGGGGARNGGGGGRDIPSVPAIVDELEDFGGGGGGVRNGGVVAPIMPEGPWGMEGRRVGATSNVTNFSPNITFTGRVDREVIPYLTSEIEDVLDRQRRGLYSGVME